MPRAAVYHVFNCALPGKPVVVGVLDGPKLIVGPSHATRAIARARATARVARTLHDEYGLMRVGYGRPLRSPWYASWNCFSRLTTHIILALPGRGFDGGHGSLELHCQLQRGIMGHIFGGIVERL